jgi:hypothetical protein
MSENWVDEELDYCVRAYMWMLDAQSKGLAGIKKSRVDKALRAGPLKARNKLDYRFANISHLIQLRHWTALAGYKAQPNVGPNVAPRINQFIDLYANGGRHCRRLHCLVSGIPSDTIIKAADALAFGEEYDFPESTTYDVSHKDALIAPKQLISYASLLYYGIPLNSDNFTGGEGSQCFRQIMSAGLAIIKKVDSIGDDPESSEFRIKVSASKSKKREPSKGNQKPTKRSVTTFSFQRDAGIVADAEERAGGKCELCDQVAPFLRNDGTPFLEVHHIIQLSDHGPDVLENVAALCPNCHRACHHSAAATEIKSSLLDRFGA